MEKINYWKKSLTILDAIDYTERRPRILLHACCGPCVAFPLRFLSEHHFDITIYFNNSNIFPQSEYMRRLQELQRFVTLYSQENQLHIDIIVRPYDNDAYNVDLEPYKDDPEGETRCLLCYTKRMDEAFKYAEEQGYDFFTTVMTISRQKNSQVLNAIGEKLQVKYSRCHYFFSDFKKHKGIDIGREMRIAYDMYQQDYCGCKYTFSKSQIYKNKVQP